MKVTIIGAGSLFFTRRMIIEMMHLPAFRGADLALVDLDPWRCEQMLGYARKLKRDTGGHLGGSSVK